MDNPPKARRCSSGRATRDPGKTAPMCQASTGAARWLGRESNGGQASATQESRMTNPQASKLEPPVLEAMSRRYESGELTPRIH